MPMTSIESTETFPFPYLNAPQLTATGDLCQKVSYYLHLAGSQLKAPTFWFTEKAVHFFSPVQSGEHIGRYGLRTYTGRVLLVALLTLAMMPAPGTVGIGLGIALGASATSALVGCIIKLIARTIDRRDFLHLQAGKPKTFDGASLSVVTANICAFEGGLGGLCGGVLPLKNRIDRLVQTLIKNPVEGSAESPDVITLQEVWSFSAARALIDRLSRLGYKEFYFSVGDGAFVPGAALFVASKHKLANPEVKHFSNIGRIDMQRCFFSVELPSNSGEKIRILTTHLSPSKNDEKPTRAEHFVRQKQLGEIIKTVDPHEHLVITGDFNMQPEALKKTLGESQQISGNSSESKRLTIQCERQDKQTCTMNLSHRYFKDPTIKPEICLDYILTQNTLNSSDQKASIIPLYEEPIQDCSSALSDHHGLRVELKFQADFDMMLG